ncbi:MAG: hypothetical protein M3297_09585 [Thermoproteota archaeon]|nr:hypothetical protein [Thermoproteota archaeon]
MSCESIEVPLGQPIIVLRPSLQVSCGFKDYYQVSDSVRKLGSQIDYAAVSQPFRFRVMLWKGSQFHIYP